MAAVNYTQEEAALVEALSETLDIEVLVYPNATSDEEAEQIALSYTHGVAFAYILAIGPGSGHLSQITVRVAIVCDNLRNDGQRDGAYEYIQAIREKYPPRHDVNARDSGWACGPVQYFRQIGAKHFWGVDLIGYRYEY